MAKRITLFLTLLCVYCFASAADYLTFTAEEDSSTVKILSNEDYREALDGPRIVVTDDTIYEYVGDSIIIEANKPDLQYSIDGGLSWDTLAIGSTIMLENKGDKVQLRGNNPAGFSKNNEIRSYFSMTGSIAASGNVMSLIDVTCESVTIPNAYCFYALFKNCTSLTQAPDLPATTLTRSCYMKMFNGCTNLTQVPDLPATRLAKGCCKDMFSGCTSLTKAPKLLATTLAKNCYYEMFMNCTGLTQVPDLSATELANGCYQYMFSGCTGLTQAPKLPATTLADSCYFGMFKGCGSLTQTSDLPATELVSSCYEDMFNDCTGLTQAPKLPATTLAKNCYREMFIGCTSLTKMPELPATTLVSRCYEGMFYKCTSLTQMSELPATKLAIYCYTNMFSGCSSLTQTPDLPATALASGCYNEMFSNCTNLTQAPELFATEVADYFCLDNMFKSCKKLSEITVHFSSWWDVDELLGITTNWVEGVASTGTFICPKELSEEYGTDRIPAGWTVKYLEESESAVDYLTFTAEEDNSSFYPELKPYVEENTGFADNPPSMQYSLDNGQTWIDFQFPTGDPVVLEKKGDKVLLRGNNPYGLSPEFQHYVQFVMTGSIAASGNIQTLIDTTGESLNALSFEYLFKDCTSLTKAPDLPATNLIENCYYAMFSGCTNLTQAPKILPATQAQLGCYNSMFSGCTSLTKAPELLITELEMSCCQAMFKGCTNLSEIKVNFTEWTESYEWVEGVASTGTFICSKELPEEYGKSNIPEGWTVKYLAGSGTNYLAFTAEADNSTFGITNEFDASPDIQYSLDGGESWNILSAGDTILLAKKGDKALLRGDNPHGFSKNMSNYTHFQMTGSIAASGSVMSLVDNTGESVTIPDSSGFFKLFAGCTSLTQAPELPATQLTTYCYSEMFERCSGLTKAPKLPATILTHGCYEGMFAECSGLTQASDLPATQLDEYCYARMFAGCTSLTTAPKLPATELDKVCYRMMFRGCTSLTQAPELPATTLAEECYAGMFAECTGLTQAPKLPATTLADNCYEGMFLVCTSLTEAPELPATTLAKECYMQMFKECSNLSLIKVNFTQWPELLLICTTGLDYNTCDSTSMGWVDGVAPTGTFVCPKALPEEYGPQRIPQGWRVEAFGGVGTENFSSTGLAIWNEGRTLFVRGAEGLVEVYNLNGQLLRAAQGNGGETIRFIMPAEGVYVVKNGSMSQKTRVD